MKIAIIGAGIAGITCAKELQNLGHQITIFEKSRGIGGRLSNRRTEKFHFDIGAQYFTAKTTEFDKLVQKLLKNNVAAIWNPKFSEIDGCKITKSWNFSEHILHYVGIAQMNEIAKFIAKNLDIKLQTRIAKTDFINQKWHLEDESAKNYSNFDLLIITAPPKQAIELVPQDFCSLKSLQSQEMQACFTLMLGFKENIEMDFQAAIVKNSTLSWIAQNNSKPQRPQNLALTINSTNKFADENFDKLEKKQIIDQMTNELKKIIHFKDVQIEHRDLQKWRYANSKKQKGESFLFDEKLKLGICGDYFIQGRVENAFLSARNLLKSIY